MAIPTFAVAPASRVAAWMRVSSTRITIGGYVHGGYAQNERLADIGDCFVCVGAPAAKLIDRKFPLSIIAQFLH
jgi:hypothetical protein